MADLQTAGPANEDFFQAPSPEQGSELLSGLNSLISTIGGVINPKAARAVVDEEAAKRAQIKKYAAIGALALVAFLAWRRYGKKK